MSLWNLIHCMWEDVKGKRAVSMYLSMVHSLTIQECFCHLPKCWAHGRMLFSAFHAYELKTRWNQKCSQTFHLENFRLVTYGIQCVPHPPAGSGIIQEGRHYGWWWVQRGLLGDLSQRGREINHSWNEIFFSLFSPELDQLSLDNHVPPCVTGKDLWERDSRVNRSSQKRISFRGQNLCSQTRMTNSRSHVWLSTVSMSNVCMVQVLGGRGDLMEWDM